MTGQGGYVIVYKTFRGIVATMRAMKIDTIFIDMELPTTLDHVVAAVAG